MGGYCPPGRISSFPQHQVFNNASWKAGDFRRGVIAERAVEGRGVVRLPEAAVDDAAGFGRYVIVYRPCQLFTA
jgi:hypothetical protein